MRFCDITNQTDTRYSIDQPDEYVFFFRNKTGDLSFDILSSGCAVSIFGMFDANDNDRFDLNLEQNHLCPGSKSTCLIKSVLRNNSTLHLTGTVTVAKTAAKTEALFANRNLLFGKHCRVQSEPRLKILANDVKCSHAATTSPPNRDHVFYLQLRGIQEDDAHELIANGFLEEILSVSNRHTSSL